MGLKYLERRRGWRLGIRLEPIRGHFLNEQLKALEFALLFRRALGTGIGDVPYLLRVGEKIVHLPLRLDLGFGVASEKVRSVVLGQFVLLLAHADEVAVVAQVRAGCLAVLEVVKGKHNVRLRALPIRIERG